MFLVIVFAQQPKGYFNLTGNVKVEHGLVEGTNIQINRNGALLNNVSVNRTGNFRLRVDLGHEYLFIFSKEGYYPKSFKIDTRLPDGVCDNNCIFPPYQVSLLLYKNVPGVDHLKQDIAVISYNPKIDNFDADIIRDAKSLKDELPSIKNDIKNKSEQYERESLNVKTDNYNKAIREANQHASRGNYEQAMHLYRDALMIFPGRMQPREQVNRMYQLLMHEQLTETLGIPNESNLLKYINYGDLKMKEREYTEAKVAFEIASRIKPGDEEIISRLHTATAEVENLNQLAIDEVEHFDLVYESRKKRYNELIKQGDEKFLEEELAAAKEFYSLAVPQIKESSYALLMVEKIDELMYDDDLAKKLALEREEAERKRLQEARNRAYDDAVAEADRNFEMRLYRDAIEYYELALSIKGYELYPKNQIRIINSILAKLQLEGEGYNKLIREADAFMYDKKYREARPLYVEANRLIPNEQYAKGKIEEIDNLLAGLKNEQELRTKYDALIARADNLFEKSDYDNAIEIYQEALLVLPDEKYPADQISKIRGILSREANEQKRLAQQKTDYERTVAMADKAFYQESYQPARSLYLQALSIIPGQEYPRSQINIIDEILNKRSESEVGGSNLERIDFSNLQDVSRELREAAYKEAMELGESFILSKEWGLARFYFRRALALMPNDDAAGGKLTFVEQQIMGVNVNESKYAEMIQRADEAFDTGDFGVARFYYMKAREVKPADEYVNERIQVVTRLAETTAARTVNREYDDAMKRAGEAFEAENYSVARFFYRRALSLKANDALATEKLREVESIINK
jgi:tetratricopeptide (TPR) repeat protein